MALVDFSCDSCKSRFEVLLGGGFEAPTDCPDCGASGLRREWTFRGHVSQTAFQTEGERFLAHRHAKDIEARAADGTLQSLKLSGRDPGPKPDIPRRLY